MLMQTTLTLEPTMTINSIVARNPETIPVFNRLGMDTCCGGGVSVEEAARRDGLALETVMAELRQAIEAR
jgi:regulator of cell morphogenesis and NO signaling